MDVAVERVDYEVKKVVCSDGSQWTWSKLLLATGARALVPSPARTTARSTVCAPCRTPSGSRPGWNAAASAPPWWWGAHGGHQGGGAAAQAGCGRHHGGHGPGHLPCGRPCPIGRVIEDRVRAKGVDLRFGSGISAITRSGETLTASFSDGAGDPLRPGGAVHRHLANTALAGEAVKVGRGIVVDEHMRTNVEGVYAAGDCCEGLNRQSGQTQIIGLWANAASQGEVAGTNMAGRRRPYRRDSPQYHPLFRYGLYRLWGQPGPGFGAGVPQRRRSAPSSGRSSGTEKACLNLLDNYKVSGVMKDYVIRRLDGSGTALYPRGRHGCGRRASRARSSAHWRRPARLSMDRSEDIWHW